MRLSNLSDYAIVMLSAAARAGDASVSAAMLAEETGVPLPTAQKLMDAGQWRRLPPRAGGLPDQPCRYRRGGRRPDRDDVLCRGRPPRLRAGDRLQGQAALERGEHRGEGRARRGKPCEFGGRCGVIFANPLLPFSLRRRLSLAKSPSRRVLRDAISTALNGSSARTEKTNLRKAL